MAWEENTDKVEIKSGEVNASPNLAKEAMESFIALGIEKEVLVNINSAKQKVAVTADQIIGQVVGYVQTIHPKFGISGADRETLRKIVENLMGEAYEFVNATKESTANLIIEARLKGIKESSKTQET